MLESLVRKASARRDDHSLLPVLEVAKARRAGVDRYQRDPSGAFIVPGAIVSVTFDDGTTATGTVQAVSTDQVTVQVGGKSVKAPVTNTSVVQVAGVDADGFDEVDRQDCSRVAWLSGRWPDAERLTALREAQRSQPADAWVLHDKAVGDAAAVVEAPSGY